MKRLLIRLLIFIMPFVLLLAMFVAYEPYNYWGLNKEGAFYDSRPLSSVRELLREQPENILIGDSRTANLSTDYIEQVTGESYVSLAFGGASLNEAFELFWYATEHTNLKKVVLGVDFYRFNDGNRADNFNGVDSVAEHPMQHITNLYTWLRAASNAKTHAQNFLNVTLLGHPERYIYPDADNPSDFTRPQPTLDTTQSNGYRADIYEYTEVLYQQCKTYSSFSGYAARLQEIIDYCAAVDIELVVMILPCNRAIWDQLIYPLELDQTILEFKDFLKSRVIVYDMEFDNDYAKDDSNFLDGIHVVRDQKMALIRAVFNDDYAPTFCFKTTPAQYNTIRKLEAATGQTLLPPLQWQPGYAAPFAEDIIAAAETVA